MKERQRKILTLLGETAELSVAALAQALSTSQVTVRKDIDFLAKGGYVHRRHGYVTAGSSDNIAGRLLVAYEKKLAIAKAAAGRVQNGDTILIESGSSCAILAKLLAESRENLTVLTNSLFIADFIGGQARVVVSGGDLQPDSKALCGPLAALSLKQFYGKILFCGIDGVDFATGFTLSDHSRADTVRAMAGSAKEVFVLTTSDKLRRRGAAMQLGFSQVSGIFTDDGITSEEEKALEARGVAVMIVKEHV